MVHAAAPYRRALYDGLGETFDTTILTSGREVARADRAWLEKDSGLRLARVKRTWGLGVRLDDKRHGHVFESHFLQVNPGYWFDLARIRPHAIISSDLGFRSLVAFFYGRLHGVPVWITWEGTLHTEGSRRLGWLRHLVRSALARTRLRWISYGTAATAYLRSIGVRRDRIVQVQSCVDEAMYAGDASPTVTLEPRPVLLCIGRMVGLKGVDRLLQAAAAVQHEGYEFSLLLVGDGPEKPHLKSMAAELQLDSVTFLDAVGLADTPGIYRSADVVVVPTLNDVWGLVVNEAILLGVPVIASIYAGATADLVPEQNRFDPLVEPSFAAALRRALTGHVAAPDPSVLWPSRRVADTIGRDILEHLSPRPGPEK